MPVFQETRTTIRQSIGGPRGLLLDVFTATQASPNAVRLQDAAFRNADQGRGLNLYVINGSAAGQARTTVSMTPLVIGTGCIFYAHLDFSPTPSTDSSIELWRGIKPTEVNDHIDEAIRAAARKILDHKEDYSIQLGDPLRHWGSFERWPDGTGSTNAPDGWTLSGTGASAARNAVIKYSGRYSARLNSGNSQEARFESDDIPNWPSFAGEVVSVFAKVYTTTGARVRLQLLDGVNTFDGGLHDGVGGWDGASGQPISIDAVTISGALTRLRVRCTILAGTVMAAYWGKVWMEHNGRVYDFELQGETADETAFAYISEAWAESRTQPGEFNIRIPNEYWTIDADSTTRRIIFKKGLIDEFIGRGRQVKLVGQSHPRLPQADTDKLEVDPEYVRLAASYRVMEHLPWNDVNRSLRDRFHADALRLLTDLTTTPYPDAIPVEAW